MRSLGAWRAVAIVLALVACSRESEAPPAAPSVILSAQNVATASVAELQSGPLLSGNLAARREATLRSEVSGPVRTVAVEAGQHVKQGQMLGEVGDWTLHEMATSARTAAASAAHTLDVAKAEEARARRLVREGALAAREIELAVANRAKAEAALAQAQAQRATAVNQLRRSHVRAPFDGVVGDRMVSVGDVVQPGAPLFKVIDPGSLRLYGTVPVETAARIQRGTSVPFSVAGHPERRFEGKVVQINPSVDPSTGQVRITVELPNDAGGLLAGVYAEGRVTTERKNVLALPADAVSERGTNPTVLRIEGDQVKRVPVTLGMRDPVGERVEIASGLEAGDRVLRQSAGDLADGTRVEVQSPGPEQPPKEPSTTGVGGSGEPSEG